MPAQEFLLWGGGRRRECVQVSWAWQEPCNARARRQPALAHPSTNHLHAATECKLRSACAQLEGRAAGWGRAVQPWRSKVSTPAETSIKLCDPVIQREGEGGCARKVRWWELGAGRWELEAVGLSLTCQAISGWWNTESIIPQDLPFRFTRVGVSIRFVGVVGSPSGRAGRGPAGRRAAGRLERSKIGLEYPHTVTVWRGAGKDVV